MNKQVALNMENLGDVYNHISGSVLSIKRSDRDKNGRCETVVTTSEGQVTFVDYHDSNNELPVAIHNKIIRELFLGIKVVNDETPTEPNKEQDIDVQPVEGERDPIPEVSM